MREADGLAMSSRNSKLNQEERQRAVVLSRALFAVEKRHQSGERDAQKLIEEAQRILQGIDVEYCRVVDPETLEDIAAVSRGALVAVAARLGSTRLIDNLVL